VTTGTLSTFITPAALEPLALEVSTLANGPDGASTFFAPAGLTFGRMETCTSASTAVSNPITGPS